MRIAASVALLLALAGCVGPSEDVYEVWLPEWHDLVVQCYTRSIELESSAASEICFNIVEDGDTPENRELIRTMIRNDFMIVL